MTVSKLIAALSTKKQDAEVEIYDDWIEDYAPVRGMYTVEDGDRVRLTRNEITNV